MSPFPISKSFLHHDALARQIECEYPLERVACQLITSTLRDVYLVTSLQGKHILYIYPSAQRTREEILAEWEFVGYLCSSGLPVAPSVPQKSGEMVLSFDAPEGTRFGVMTQFVDGVILRQRSTLAVVRAFGQTVARIHLLADQMPFVLHRTQLDYERMVHDSWAAFQCAASDRPEDLDLICRSADLLLGKLAVLPRDMPSYGVIHGDVIRANALVRDDDTITVIDFDFCGLGWRAYDVASYLLTIRGTPEEDGFRDAFLDGYNGVRPLTPAERGMLPLFEAVRAIYSIGIPAMNIQHWGSRYFYSFVDHDLAALRSCVQQLG